MKLSFRRNTFVILIFLISSTLFLGYRYTTKNLKSLLPIFLKENFNTQLSIGRVGFGFPLCLELKDVKIQDAIDIETVQIYPSPLSFLLKKGLIISTIKIVNPVVRIEKMTAGQFVVPDFLKEKEREKESSLPVSGFYFSKIRVHNGTLIYDEGKDSMQKFVGIKGVLESPMFHLPKKDTTLRFKAVGFLKNKGSDFLSPLRIDGRIESGNVLKARFQASDIKIDTLGPIYAKYLSNIVKEARINFDTDIQISKTNLVAKCLFKGEDILLKEGLDQKIDAPLVADFILLFNFKSKMLKLKNLRSNFLELVLNRP